MPPLAARPRSLASAPLALLVALGCTAGSGLPDGGDDGMENDERQCHDGNDNDGDGWVDCVDPGCFPIPSCSGGGDAAGRDAGFSSCSGDLYDAQESFQPVDIIWVVDTSGSMSDEADRVQENLHAFATAIGEVGIDWRVVMVSRGTFVEVPPALADDPRYLLIDREIDSVESLRALLTEFPRYESFLRRRAATHFIAVTDDESDLPWESFRTDMQRNLMRNFVFHAIASEVAEPSTWSPEGACQIGSGFPPEGAAAPGIEYYELAAATGGRTFSICTPSAEWAGLFDTLTAAIAIPVSIPCEYAIPESDDLDYGRVNVRYDAGSGGSLRFPYVGTSDGANCTDGGWYYDDPEAPTRIQLCPSTCSLVNGDAEGSVSVELGCLSVLI